MLCAVECTEPVPQLPPGRPVETAQLWERRALYWPGMPVFQPSVLALGHAAFLSFPFAVGRLESGMEVGEGNIWACPDRPALLGLIDLVRL